MGLFRDRVAEGENRIFTGNKSAVDLIGIRNTELVLVELKKRGNCKVGAISELLFYSSLMRDALKKLFRFEDRPPRRNCEVTRTDIMGCTSISAVLLAPDFHPLIRNPEIIARLNAALASPDWSKMPIQLDVVRIDSIPDNPGEDFSFSWLSRASAGNANAGVRGAAAG